MQHAFYFFFYLHADAFIFLARKLLLDTTIFRPCRQAPQWGHSFTFFFSGGMKKSHLFDGKMPSIPSMQFYFLWKTKRENHSSIVCIVHVKNHRRHVNFNFPRCVNWESILLGALTQSVSCHRLSWQAIRFDNLMLCFSISFSFFFALLFPIPDCQ